VPQLDNHFGNLIDEIDRKEPFYMLGSIYEGNKWDGFRDQMDEDLLTHLNGNGVYNVSHPCFRMVLEKMEEENSGTQAFDVAARRILREFFPMCENQYKQTNSIDNLAATLVHADELNVNASYIHGAKVMNLLNYSITAIISGFAGRSSTRTVQNLINRKRGFSSLIMVDDHGEPGASGEFTEVQIRGTSDTMLIKNITRYPGTSPARDFCLALEHVETPYFTVSNVFRVPSNLIPINDDHGRIMIACLLSKSPYCNVDCQREAAGATFFTAPPTPQPTEQWFISNASRGLMSVPLMPEGGHDDDICVINGDAMVWSSESAKRYCSMLDEKLPKSATDD
jgi:hypothetical protein